MPQQTPRRLFLALWPSEAERSAIAAAQAGVAWQPDAKLVPRENLHLTLHFLGNVDGDRLAALRVAAAVSAAPVSVTFDCFTLWHGGIAVLEPLTLPPALTELHDALREALIAAAFTIERRPYRPHVTLARHGQGAVHRKPVVPITWQASSYALVESAGGRYTVLQEQLLRG
jgi:2'-5' RNA ligase